MTEQLKQFIQDNKNLINENTKESWEDVYNKLYNSTLRGEFTDTLLTADIDPAKNLSYIPRDYLRESKITFYKIPDGVTSIGGCAFYYCDSLTEIVIPNSVTTINSSAFYGCDSLTSIKIPNSVTSIGNNAFTLCKSLTSVVIPDSVTLMDEFTFRYCYSLTKIVIPDSVTEIGYGVFSSCYDLTNIVIPNSVTIIGDEVFYRCKNLKEIQFKGTKKEAMQLGIGNKSRKRWRAGSLIEKIICNDGIIEL